MKKKWFFTNHGYFFACVGKFLKIMKIFIFLIAFASMQTFALDNYAQTKRMDMKIVQSSIVSALEIIENQSEFFFFYNNKVVKLDKKVSVDLKDKSINEILDAVFTDTDVEYTINDRQIILSINKSEKSSAQQQRSVKGKVTDSSGATLPGVSVVVKGTTTGVITDNNGNFSLVNIPENASLQFSFVGMKTQEFTTEGKTTINVKLSEEAIGLDEVVAVGYSNKKASELSSSVAVVNEKALQGVTSNNLSDMVQGKVPGLVVSNTSGNPGQNANIVIRGVGSIGAGYSPLYVVDGIIGGDANPNDIESITVLKDAAATGLYGSRASNGVIIITTKSGKSGKTKINYSGSYGISQHLDGNLQMMNSSELYDFQKNGYQNYFNSRVAVNDPNFANISFENYLPNVLSPSRLNVDTDWQSLLSRTGKINKQQLSISGGNEKTTFYVSGNYYDESGTVISTYYKSMGFRANFKHKISDKVTLYVKVSGNNEKSPNDPLPGQEGVIAQYYINMPWDSPYEADGITPYNPVKAGSTWLGNGKSNYIYDREHYSDITKKMGLSSDLKLDVKITDWMSFSTSNRWQFSGSDWTQLLDKNYILSIAEKGRISQTYTYQNSYLTSNLFNLKHNFGNHYFSGVLGQEYSYSKWNSTGAVGMDMVEGLSALSSAGSPKSVSGTSSETGFLSYFGQMDYNYKGRYFLVGSARRDASSRFGANNKWGTFLTMGTSWVINRETFLSQVSWIDLLKIKFSYGTTGNANIADYLSMGTYGFATANTYNGNSGARPSRIANPDLTWEKAYTTNLGFEFSVFKRIKLEIDLYNRDNKDLLQNVPLSAASGFTGQQRNVGSVRNQGIDFNLTTVNLDGDFRWETNFNLNINKNKVLALNNSEDIANGSMRIREGLDLRYFYMREWAGVDPQTGDPLWVRWEDENGKIINGADKKDPTKVLTTNQYNQASNLFIRSAYPDLTGGIRNDLSYKNFSFSVLCNMSFGQWIYFGQRERIDSDGTFLGHNQMKPYKDWVRWEKPGDITTHPRIVSGGNLQSSSPSSRYLEDGSYFRIQNVNLSYTFPKVYSLISALRVYASVDNLALFTKFSGADPDVNIENPQITQDANSARYSPTKKILFGISLDF